MPFCRKCGRGLPLDADYCSNCGNPVEGKNEGYTAQNTQQNYTYTQAPPTPPYGQDDGGAARRQKVLDNFYLRLKWERKAWSITGKVMTILGGVCAGLFVIFLVVALATWSEASALFGTYAYLFFIYALITLPVGIVSIIMTGKVKNYMDGLYDDCGPAVTRGESIGMIIFNYIFNGVALVFYVINFIHVKNNKKDFEEIRRLQLNAKQNNNTVYWQ